MYKIYGYIILNFKMNANSPVVKFMELYNEFIFA